MYEYQCNDCGHRFEVRQSFTDSALTECPTCTGRVRRVMHAAGVIFKGSGWYITDSRKATSEPASSSPSNPTTKSDTATSEPTKSADAVAKIAAAD
jgi:putative FmdB family regulatory protein